MAQARKAPPRTDWSTGPRREILGIPDRRADETGPLLRLLFAGGAVLVAAIVAAVLARFADTGAKGIVALELAGSSEHARTWYGSVGDAAYVGTPEIHHMLLLDLLLIAFYSAVLFLGIGYFGRRGFRVAGWRLAAPALRWVPVIAGGLDVLENLGIWIGSDHRLSTAGWLELLWAAIAAVAWAKFGLLLLAAGYLLIAVCAYIGTPPWLRNRLLAPPDANVRLSPYAAASPSATLLDGTPPPRAFSATSADTEPARYGIAIAGGGIRSAAHALGALQELDRDPDGPNWTTADRVSSVSGGSYLAGGYSVARSARRNSRPPSCGPDDPGGAPAADSQPAQPPGPCDVAWNSSEPENEFLIEHLGYLLAKNPSGQDEKGPSSDVPGVLATLLLGLLLNAVLLLVPLWLAVQPLAWLVKSDVVACKGYDDPTCVTSRTVWPTTLWIVLALGVLVIWVAAGWVRGAFSPGGKVFRLTNFVYLNLRLVLYGIVGVALVMTLVLVGFPALVSATPTWLASAADWAQPAAIIGALAATASAATSLLRPLSRFAPQLGGVCFVAVLVLLSAHWASTAIFQPWDHDRLADVWNTSGAGHPWGIRVLFQTWSLVGAFPNHAWLLCLLGWFLAYALLNPMWWSMAPFYRGKLRGAFATYRRSGVPHAYDGGNEPTPTAEPSLYELIKRVQGRESGSPLQICATATVSGRSVRTHYGIPALSMTFDPNTVRLNIPTDDEGGWSAYQCSTSRFERLLYRRGGSRFTTMMAVGISGAAVSPAMGKFKIGPARALLALLNIRLGVWVPNPKYVAAWRPDQPDTRVRPSRPGRVPYPPPRLGYLIKEAFGVHDPEDLYLYVTDGGHWENTGLVELFREQNFLEVVCLDADAGERDTVTQLANAVSLAELEVGARIAVDLDPLRSPLGARRGKDYATRSVTVGLVRRGNRRGLLWYAKPALTVDTPPDVLSYGENDPAFPTTSTVDQFFHAAKFGAYRDLGRYNAYQVVVARRAVLAAFAGAPKRAGFSRAAGQPGAHWAVVALDRLISPDDDHEYAILHDQMIRERLSR